MFSDLERKQAEFWNDYYHKVITSILKANKWR